jgi:hypothetical protein
MPAGSPDFKRRFSEDLGATLASLLITHAFQVQWHTIAQIPMNQGLTSESPDFVGFTNTNVKKVYEAKGTTQPDAIDAARSKAKSQLASFKESGVAKYAIVSFVSCLPKLLPSMMFLSDPPLDTTRMSMYFAVGRHTQRVLDYSALGPVDAHLRRLLELYIRNEPQIVANSLPQRRRNAIEAVSRDLLATMGTTVAHAAEYGAGTLLFIGRRIEVTIDRLQLRVFCGVEKTYLTKLIRAIADSALDPPRFNTIPFQLPPGALDDQIHAHVFPDGTILVVESAKGP